MIFKKLKLIYLVSLVSLISIGCSSNPTGKYLEYNDTFINNGSWIIIENDNTWYGKVGEENQAIGLQKRYPYLGIINNRKELIITSGNGFGFAGNSNILGILKGNEIHIGNLVLRKLTNEEQERIRVEQEREQERKREELEREEARKKEEQIRRAKELYPYVDLGLPSRTLWKNENEKGLYSYGQAVRKFGKNLPTKEQFQELISKCKWEHSDEHGYLITGPNGNSIVLHFNTGYSSGIGPAINNPSYGFYWSSTRHESYGGYYLELYSVLSQYGIEADCMGFHYAVRLVKKE